MLVIVTIIFMLPVLTSCSSDGNINLLKEEVAVALRTCSNVNDVTYSKDINRKRQRRYSGGLYDDAPECIDANPKQEKDQHNHERCKTSGNKTLMGNGSNSDRTNHGREYNPKNFVHAIGNIGLDRKVTNTRQYNQRVASIRIKRKEPLINKEDNDQCLSQCVFANLQVVNSKGIPREADLWNKMQTSVTSQQLRILLKDQVRACFHELQNESEDNGCSYSNKLERCLMLRFSDRQTNGTLSKPSDKKT